ncbi:uncharacterized protein RCO7_06181 [Rhynchosporium graminicola]|uniref:Involucrin repeat protein n=1 Tax=Rhynchosporium graminicola TaxID=2792576 RepID=A0A1E1KYR3_9HELO|nr:uncharacterized protein RCO7_06181 [Rhynchosporium commune]
MAPERRRRSPEGYSSSSKRPQDPRADYNELPRMRSTPQSYPYSSSASSSSSNSIIDISHSYPPKRSGIRTFFTTPSERKLRKRRSSRLMKNSNSSSSSVSSDRDLAYGHGYIKRPKLRRVRSRAGREIDRERHGDRYNERYNERQSDRYSDREGGKVRHNERERDSAGSSSSGVRGKIGTTAGILAVGAGLRAIAAEQNKRDLREARNGKKPELSNVRDHAGNSYGESRGIGPSKPSHGPDEDGWESASDSESSVDSRLAFGNDTSAGWSFFGRKKKHKPMSRKSSVVDPRLFGPENSLHGLVVQPVGFGNVAWTSTSDFGDQRETYQRDSYSTVRQQSFNSSTSQVPLQQIPPMPMSDVDRSEPPRYTSEPQQQSAPMRPDPVPIQIQHPKPFTPVSQSIYEPIYPSRSEPIIPTRSESGGILKSSKTPSSSGRGKSLAGAAVAGVAAAAVGSLISSARDDRKDRQREDEIEALERDRIRRRDSEKRESKDESRRNKRSSPPREDRKDKRREKPKDKDDTEERRREKKRDERRGETRDEKEDRREKRREERRVADKSDDRFDSRRTKSEAAVSTTSVDPFQYQIDNNSFTVPPIESSSGHKRTDSVPTVVTVERIPDFSRKRSSSIKSQPAAPKPESRREPLSSQREYSDQDDQEQRYRQASEPGRKNSEWHEREERYRGVERRDRVLHDAEASIHDAKRFTGPYDAAVITAVVAAEHHRETRADERRRERQKDANYDVYTSTQRDITPARDPIQEEADRAYREIVMARKIASQVIRSRSPSPDPSVVHKYDRKNQKEEIVRIVTPPGMEEHKGKGPYDAPNADFRLDYVLEHPKDLQSFSIPSFGRNRSISEPIRDPDASEPRPLLNLVRPTPTPSPMPEKQIARSEPGRKNKSKSRDTPKRSFSSDIVIGPKGNIIASPTASNVSKGVTWGENDIKHYEVESPSEHRYEFLSKTDVKSRDSTASSATPKGDKGWGAVAAGIIGAGVGATAANEISKSSKSQEDAKPVPYEYRGIVVEPEKSPGREDYRRVVVEPESPPRKERQRSPPSPGPKPTMPQIPYSTHMPGSFDDDLDFTATVAAGLQDTGFDPNIVIDDPTFRRRDSPPGSNDTRLYQAPYAETVTDLGTSPSEISRTRGTEGFVIGEVGSTSKHWPGVSPTENDESYSKLSKKDQKKRDKAAKRQSAESTPIDEPSVSREVEAEPESYFEAPLSKKEQKKRDKAAKRQSSQADDITPFSEPSVAADIVQEPESYFETPKKSKKSKVSSTYDDSVVESPRERTVSVPVDAFDDLQNGEDEWAETPKKSKKKSKRDSDRYESPPRAAPVETASELARSISKKSKRESERYESPARSAPSSEISSSGKKSKDKSSRRSGQFDYEATEVPLPPSGTTSEISSVSKKSKDKSSRKGEQSEYDPTEVSLPPSTPSETSRDGEFEDLRGTRRSSTRDSGIFNSEDRGDSRSVVSTSTSRNDDQESRKKKKARSSTADFDDTRSVASAPAGDDYEDKKGRKNKKSGGIFSGLFGSKSEVGARDESPKRSKDDFEDVKKKSKKSKRSSVPDASSVYGSIGADSVNDLSRSVSNGHSNGNGNGSYADDNEDDNGARSDGEKRKKTRSRSESTSSKKDSFLGKAGTLGAGAGIAGVTVAAIAAHRHQQPKAKNNNSNTATTRTVGAGADHLLERDEVLDPEITERHFRPSIDPQYGDLLPLPPSDPASPNVEPLDDLPNLPDSRPNTPESDRLARERVRNVRKSVQETPMKSPSHSQVPLKFKMGGNRSTPSSPAVGRSSPLPSPANPSQESLGFPTRRKSRPSSWDNSKEFKPLYLVESTRRGSNAQLHADDEPLPQLPPSQSTSRSSSQLDDTDKTALGITYRGFDPLSIDTTLASAPISDDMLGSGQSTPRANIHRGFEDIENPAKQEQLSDIVTQLARSSGPRLEKSPASLGGKAAEIAVAAGLVSTLGYFASTSIHPKTNESWFDDLPSAKTQQVSGELPTTGQSSPVDKHRSFPVDPVTKDRSSYLLRSSPISKKSEDSEVDDNMPGSPSSRDISSTDRDALHSIQEGELGSAEASGLKHDVDDDREKALETLSSGNNVVNQQPSPELEDPIDQFSLKKSKKDRKKDKNGKGTSSSEMRDDPSLPEPDASQTSNTFSPIESESVESFSKSKKDKKNKKKNVMSWDDIEVSVPQADEPPFQVKEDEPDSDTFFDAEQESFEPAVVEDTPAQQDEFSAPKSKKGKKDKKVKSKMPWEPESSESQPQLTKESLPASLETFTDALASRENEEADLGEPAQVDDFSASKSKKGKKDKKGKSKMSWEPEAIETQPAALQTFSDAPTSREIAQEDLETSVQPVGDSFLVDEQVSKAIDVSSEGIQTSTNEPTADAAFDEFPSSKKKSKKDKRKSAATSDWDERGIGKAQLQDEQQMPDPSFENVQTLGKDDLTDVPCSSASKKDKKKDKKKGKVSLWEVEDTETSQNPSKETPDIDDSAQIDDFSTPKSTGKKNKESKAAAWEPEPELLGASELREPAFESRDLPDDVSVPFEDPQPIDDFPSMSKKDKKKKQKGKASSTWDAEDDSALQPSTFPGSGFKVDAQEIPTPVEEPFAEFPSAKKKDRKKDKKKNQALSAWEPELDNAVVQLASVPKEDTLSTVIDASEKEPEAATDETNRDKTRDMEQPLSTLANPSLPELQGEQNNLSQPRTDEAVPETKSLDEQPETRDLVSTNDEFGFTESKKSNKKKGKATMSWADEVESSIPECLPQTSMEPGKSPISGTPPVGDLESGFTSKKDKKKKKKSSSAWDPDHEAVSPTSPVAVEEPVFTTPSSKKDKKKGRKLQQWDEPEISSNQHPTVETDRNAEPEIIDEITALATEKSVSGDTSNALYTEEILPARETPFSRPTPLGGPGGWPITPATPLTGGEQSSGEIPNSNSKGYFPAAAAAVSAAIFGSKASRIDSSSRSKEAPMEEQNPSSFDVDQGPSLETESRPSPDGLTAGYDNTQLSLARQLQEEFGKKSSKKDKKKRQSLPSTPARLPSRTRNLDDDDDAKLRARSLSNGPAGGRSATSPNTSQRDNVYGEDQLEIARQVKADFESGSRMSRDKKSKKGRRFQDDDDLLNEDLGNTQASSSTSMDLQEPEVDPVLDEKVSANNDSEVMTPDGLAAGYKEEQLSLARQMQAEFAKKASKKSKKRGNTSPPPAEREFAHDDFGDQTQFPGSGSTQSVHAQAQSQSNFEENLPMRDGLAAGYSPEQVENARRLKEEFEPVPKKKGPDKKEKKHGSLLRSNTEDDFSSDQISGDLDTQHNFDNSQPSGTVDEIDDFATIGKKSKNKKDKKGKQGIRLPSTSDHDSPTETSFEKQTLSQADDLPRSVTGEELSAEPESMELEVNDFSSIGKWDKKSKKSKKQENSLYGATGDDTFDLADTSKHVDVSHDASEETSSKPEPIDPTADPEDDFAFSTKKSKKDKKKRQSSVAIEDFPDQQMVDTRALPSEDLTIDDTTAATSAIPIDEVGADDFGFSSKKKDKKKKRGSLLRNESFNANIDEQSDDHESLPTRDSQIESMPSPVDAEPQDDFDFSSKQSKKDKKKRGSLLRNQSFSAAAEVQPEEPEFAPTPESQIDTISSPLGEDQQDDFEFSSKKSKKDKKKRGSLPQTGLIDAVTEQRSDDHDSAPSLETPVEAISSPVDEGTQKDSEFSSNGSKKDKKKRGSLLRNESFSASAKEGSEDQKHVIDSQTVVVPSPEKDKKKRGSLPQTEPFSTTTEQQPEDQEHVSESHVEAITPPVIEELQEDFEYSSKRSKKDKKKRGSLLRNEFFNANAESQNEESVIKTPPFEEKMTSLDEPTPQSLMEKVESSQFSSPSNERREPELEETIVPSESQTASVEIIDSSSELPLGHSVSRKADQNPEDVFDEFTFTKKSKKKDKKRKDSNKTDDLSEGSKSVEPLSELKKYDEPSLPVDPSLEDPVPVGHEEKDLDVFASPIADQPDDHWGDFSTKKSKKKKSRKESSKLDSEETSIPSEPTLEPSKDAALTPLPLDQSLENSVVPQLPLKRDLDRVSELLAPAHHPAASEEPKDEWSSFSVKKNKNGKDKKKQKYSSSADNEDTSGTVTPVDTVKDLDQSDSVAPETIENEQSAFLSSKDPTLITKTISEEPPDEWGSFSTKKSKKGKKDKKSGSSTPTEPLIAAAAIASSIHEPSTQEVDPEDDWGNSSSKKSKKLGKSKKSGLSTPIEEALRSDSVQPSLESVEEPILPAETIRDIPEQVAEKSKEISEIRSANIEEPTVVDPFDEWGSVPAKKSKEKKKKKTNSGFSTPLEETSLPIPEQLAEDHFGQSSTFKALGQDTSWADRKIIDVPIATEEQGDEWDDFSSKKSKKKDKKQKNSGLPTPSEELPSSEKSLPELERTASTIENVADVSVPVETYLDTKDVKEDQDDEWASFSTKPSKKDRKKQKSTFSTPKEADSDPKPEEQILETNQSSEIKPTDEALQSDLPVDVDITQVDEDQADEWGASFVKPSKKSKKDKSKRSSGIVTPIEQAEPIADRDFLESDQPSTLPALDNESAEPIKQPAAIEMEGVIENSDDIWGSVPVKQSKGKGKKNRKSSFSTPIEEPLPLDKSRATSADPVQQYVSPSDKPEDHSSGPVVDVIDEQDEWNFSAPKSKKDKKKSRKSGTSTPTVETLPLSGTEASAEKAQNIDAVLDNSRELNQDMTEDTLNEPADESATPPKKSKDNKKEMAERSPSVARTGSSLPSLAPPETAEHLEVVSTDTPPGAHDTTKDLVDDYQADDCGTSSKKKKKDKTKSGLLTPVEEPSLPINQISSNPVQQSRASIDEPELPSQVTKEAENQDDDEWSSLPTKKGKKDKKNKKQKSGVSSNAGQNLGSLPEQDQPDLAEPSTAPAHTTPIVEELSGRNLKPDPVATEEPIDEWGSLSKKKSKKDKKRKSGLSTPVEDGQAFAEKSSPSKDTVDRPDIVASEAFDKDQPAPHETETGQIPHVPQETGTETQDQLPEDDEFTFTSKPLKLSKKDKKRKSGISTPIEETPSQDVSESLSEVTPTAKTKESQEDIKGSEEPQPQSFAKDEDLQIRQPSDGDFNLSPTKAKAKQNRKEAQADTDSGPSTPAQPRLFTSLEHEELPSIPGQARGTSPVLFETNSEEQDLFTSDLSRKLSKKDKKKRKSVVDVASESKDSVPAPLTSWADEIEEAKVVRDVPIIEEIAKDQSLSHIAPTVDSTPVDDFIRPSKKGKKGTKRNSISSVSTPVAESFPSIESRDLNDSPKAGSSKLPAIIASGAAIAGAALLDISETSTPTKKLSKKDKKKKSIDRRAPREEDIFDDPALWEGADPKIHEEEKEIDDDSDGFWSPPQHEEQPAAISELVREEPTNDRSLATSSTEAIRPSSSTFITQPELHLSNDHSPAPEVYPSSSQEYSDQRYHSDLHRESSDPAEEFVVSSSKKKYKRKKNSASNTWDFEASQDNDLAQPVAQSSALDSPTVFGASTGRGGSIDQSQISQEQVFTPRRDLFDQQHSNREVSTQESPRNLQIERPQSRSFYSRLSDLPIVHEESSTQLETNDYHGRDVDANRDSGFVTGSPNPMQGGFVDNHEHIRDSGVHLRELSPAEKTRAPVKHSDDALERLSWPSVDEDSETANLGKSQRTKDSNYHEKHHIKEQPSSGSHDSKRPKGETATNFYQAQRCTPTKDHHEETTSRDLPSQRGKDDQHTDLHRTSTVHGSRNTEGQSLVKQRMQQFQQSEPADLPRTPKPKISSSWSSERITSRVSEFGGYPESTSSRSLERSKGESRKNDYHSEVPPSQSEETHKEVKQSSTSAKSDRPKEAKYAELTSSPRPKAERSKGFSDMEAGAVIAGATLGFAAARKHSQEQRPGSAQSQRSTSNPNINRLRTPDINRPDSSTSNRSGTPPLRRSDRKSGDLRSLSQRSKLDLAKEAELATSANSTSAVNTANPTANEGRARAKDMADVYDGFGEGRMGSPRSPTRPHSMRRRQSMQVLDLEQKLEQLAAENRMLAEAKAQADYALQSGQNAPSALVERDAEIDSLKRTLEWLQNEVTRLSEVNTGLTSANMTIAGQHGDQYGVLESQHTQTARELQEAREAHENLTAGMDSIIKNEVQNAISNKDREIAQLRAELDAAKEQIRDMQRQILASKANDLEFLTVRDEDYFDNACQQLCQHVQQWVLRFSKFSDMRACRLTSEINNDKTIDRLDNAILDGSDVDNYLADRVKRRDVFMSMTMTMVWEFIFTRYLFGMDREQRQKLKSLEKTLSEVGPASAVHQWRATTLTLLAKREAFQSQREQDTRAVVHAVLETLSEILPPPSHLEAQIEEQLTRVMKAAVDLSVEMRCQRAEYMMLPPLQPEYDANGDLASKVSFNAALMNERSGDTVSNEELESQKAVVRIVLFPLVVKKGDDSGEGDEEIVVCPAQVLVAKPKKTVRLLAPESNTSKISMQSSMPAGDSVI